MGSFAGAGAGAEGYETINIVLINAYVNRTVGLADAGGGRDAAGGGGGAANELSSSHAGAAGFAGRGAEGTEGVAAPRIFESSLLAGEYPDPCSGEVV